MDFFNVVARRVGRRPDFVSAKWQQAMAAAQLATDNPADAHSAALSEFRTSVGLSERSGASLRASGWYTFYMGPNLTLRMVDGDCLELNTAQPLRIVLTEGDRVTVSTQVKGSIRTFTVPDDLGAQILSHIQLL